MENVKGFVRIKFSDNGIGMDKKTRKKVFEPFFSTKGAYSKDKSSIRGTGLGLSVSLAIIKLHKGSVRVESEKGKGATFIINLLITKLKKKISEPEELLIPEQSMRKMKDLCILVVDDEKEIRNLLRSIFTKAGCRNVFTESDGKQSLSVFKKFRPDLVFLDILMPGMDGMDILKQMKRIYPEIPVIFLSGKLEINKKELIRKGAYAVLFKPFKVMDLFSLFHKILIMKD